MGKAKINRNKISIFILIILTTAMFRIPAAFGVEKSFVNSLGMEFVLIPEGTFTMGSPMDEMNRDKNEVQHAVTLTKAFYMQAMEVTLGQWWSVMGKRFFGRRKGSKEMPVTKVSWHDAKRFIIKINGVGGGGYRLPTEAEWEYAARAGTTTAFSWGDTIDCSKAMYGNNSKKSRECLSYVRSMGLKNDQPAPVKSYMPNRWGLYDMHGNVWEWVQDWYDGYPTAGISDPRGPESGIGRVRRGGSWFKHGKVCRSANRNYAHPASRLQTTGFRLVWDQETADIRKIDRWGVPKLEPER
ncbi:MAG: formylglycine-generating enzyme family protein [Desulfobacterales bacterium]